MNHKNNLHLYAKTLISSYGKYDGYMYTLHLDELPTNDKANLARLYMESTDRETTECVHGKDFSIDNDYTCALLQLLKDDCQENKDRFAEVTYKNVIAYYHDVLQQVLNDASNNYLYDHNDGIGLRAHKSPVNGEIYWSRY